MYSIAAVGLIFYFTTRRIFDRTKPDTKKYYREALIRGAIVAFAIVVSEVLVLAWATPALARMIPSVVAAIILGMELLNRNARKKSE